MDEFSRRDFIKTTCISVGALAASSSGVFMP
ncbi:TPA: twin-arginine translocation signal domain-containing protein [Campylobacter jejuni]|nr:MULTISPECIES: twin-arginine translocation signal domain-containing protein [Campylobacter]EAI0803054.1 twin-arginine translocation signal domain-containing protein [Campylobacter jejuni]EAK1851653.1 twin-arginine translocation signal domain-containing protein [Campylobacter jejuni]ECO7059111.1 twin-arginine translocation signal domain-containing protein [Campylobacter jejuni]ECP8784232.1 twin-arginine translocation signal domain-containing protein [Campylobacter jejuni]ECR3171841.1 twin-arg